MKDAIIYVGLVQSLFTISLLLTRKKILVPDMIMVACLTIISLRFLALVLSHNHIIFSNADFSIFFIPLTFGPYTSIVLIKSTEIRCSINGIYFISHHLWWYCPFIYCFSTRIFSLTKCLIFSVTLIYGLEYFLDWSFSQAH